MKLILILALLAVAAKPFLVNAQITEVCETEMSYKYDSGNAGHASTTVRHVGAPWIQLDLSNTNLAPTAQLVLTGLSSTETLTAATLASSNGWSAVFEGDMVQVELVSSATSRVAITAIKAGVCETQPPASICGDTDDRIPSTDVRQGRWNGGCTAWLISENVFLTAGHCGAPSSNSRMHFTYGTGSAAIEDQYAADVSSYRSSDDFSFSTGYGHDFGIGRLLPNSNTGLLPGVAQSEKCDGGGSCGWYSLGAVPASTSGITMRVTGYGVAATASQSQKTHTGALTQIITGGGSDGKEYRLGYTMDTTGGNSGSPAINDNTGDAIGIHTHGGCTATGGANAATRIDHPDLQPLIDFYLLPCANDAECDDNNPSNGPETCVSGRCNYGTPPPTPAPTPAPCPSNTWVYVQITTDNYATETSYILTDTCSSTEIVSVPAGTFTSGLETYTNQYCVSAGSAFDFTISDTYGDGICCSYGNGGYAVTYESATVTGGEFTDTESIQIGSCGVTDPTTSPTPNPTTATTADQTPTPCVETIVDINGGEHPDQTSWTLANVCTGETVIVGPKVRSPNTLYSSTFCLPPARYNFHISDSMGDGMTGSGYYEVTSGGALVADSGEFGYGQSIAFGEC